MRTIILRLAEAAASDDELHGIVEVPGGEQQTFAGDAALLRLLHGGSAGATVHARAPGVALVENVGGDLNQT